MALDPPGRRMCHPCFAEAMHSRVGRVHLPVASRCNIRCNFCERRVGELYHAARPGVASRLIRPREVPRYVREALERWPAIEVAAVAGPGEPLFNPETFAALRSVRRHFPHLRLCICTNGLLLPDRLDALRKLGLEYLTVTVNAVRPDTAARICSLVKYRGRTHGGPSAGRLLLEKQWLGIGRAVKAGMNVKVNSVYVPGVNGRELPAVARRAASLGVPLMNIMPLLPGGRFARLRAPACRELRAMRESCEAFIPQFRLCKQCRADACGIPG